METWTRDDSKTRLPDGPWQHEPDKAVWIDEATGLDCMANRNHLGTWCGYVGVGPDHPWHGRDYPDLPDVDIHGDLTYAAPCADIPLEHVAAGYGVCHIPQPGRPHDVWWFGFDCGHAGDLTPGVVMPDDCKPPGYDDLVALLPRDVYRDFEYVQAQVTHLAHQVAEADG